MIVRGNVHHKGFRFAAMQKAYELEVLGIIRNQSEGSLLIEAEGTREKLDLFLEWCKKGPPGAEVTQVDIEAGELKNYTRFDIL